jgi:arsenate reductase-like glutaredoxin family protein
MLIWSPMPPCVFGSEQLQNVHIVKEEIKFYYNSGILEDRRGLGYALALKNHVINEVDVKFQRITPSQLVTLSRKLAIKVSDLLNEQMAEDLSDEDIVNLISNDMDLLKTPIVEAGAFATFLGSSYDLIKLDMAINNLIDKHDVGG